VVGKRLCCYEKNVAELFEKDAALKDKNIQGYVGMPLWRSPGDPSGILVAMYRKPITDPEFARSLVQIFASRVQVEMERNVALNDLGKSRAMLRTVFDTIPFEVWVSDSDGTCIMQNPTSQEYWGDMMRKLPDDLDLSPETAADWDEKNRRVLSGETLRMLKMIKKDGEQIYLDCIMAPIIVEGNVTGFIGVNVDVTERTVAGQQLEGALKTLSEREALLKAVFDNLPYDIWGTDTQGRYMLQNAASKELWGDFIGKMPSEVGAPDQTWQKWADNNKRALAGETVRETGLTNWRGQTRYYEDVLSPIRLDDRIIGAVGVSIDVTARRKAEMETRRALEALSQTEARLQAAFENLPLDMWISDGRGMCIMQNPVSRKYWGDFIGLVPEMMNLPEELRIRWIENNRKVLAGEIVFDRQSIQWQGSLHLMDVILAPIRLNDHVIGFVGVNIDITEQEEAKEQIHQSMERISALREIDQTILSNTDMRLVMEGIVRQTASLLEVDGAQILHYDSLTFTLEILARKGVQSYHTFYSFSVYDDIATEAALQAKIVHIRDFPEYVKQFPNCEALERESFRTYIALPLVAKGFVRGVMEIYHRRRLRPDAGWWELAQTLANQAAIAIDNLSLFQSMQRSNAELSLAYDLTLEGWSKALELRDQETEGHTQRVTNLTVRLAEAMGVPRSQVIHFRRGALLHDIGKMGIPDRILHKPAKLDDEEWELVKQHPIWARDLLLPIPFLRPALEIPYSHHERWDGSGYPLGLKGDEIPLAARIFAVVDVWDALTNDRPYHQADSPEVALAYIEEQAGKLFDPEVVTFFKRILGSK
jgi:PAS domain S-box-containing protein